MRVFFAIALPPDLSMDIAHWRDTQIPSQGSRVPAANLHITLAFVGELAEHKLERLCLSVDECLAEQPISGTTLLLNQLGYWPKHGILWLGPKEWPQPLALLASKLQGLSARLGNKRDKKPYQPHITLIRACAQAQPAPAALPTISLPYAEFTLFESRQGRQHITYQPLQHWQLLVPFNTPRAR